MKTKIQIAQEVYEDAVKFHQRVGTTKSLKLLKDCERRLNQRITEGMA